MSDLKADKKDAFAVISYHVSDEFIDPSTSFDIRWQYYRGNTSWSIPFSVIDGKSQFRGGIAGGNLYSSFLPAYNEAAASTPTVDISLSLENADHIRVDVTNTSWAGIQGTLHIALVERHKPFPWRDLTFLDFICRTMLPTPNGQTISVAPSQKFTSVQQFNIQPDWNYCSIVAFFQTADQKIVQGAMLDLEDSIPVLRMQGSPETGDLWEKGSSHKFSWTSTRSLTSVVFDYSSDAGTTWHEFVPATVGKNTYSWTVPEINSARCLLRVRDPLSGIQAASGLFGIGIKGDFNADGLVNASDRSILVDHLTENRATVLAGADLNADGLVDLFDLIYFDTTFTK